MITTAIAMSVALSTAAAAGAPVTTANAESQAPVVAVQDGGDELGFIDIYIPFMPDPLLDQTPLEPEVQENFWLLAIVSGWLPVIGAFIAPMIFLDGVELHEDFTMEAIIGSAIKLPFYWFWFIPGFYLNMVHGIQTIDRNIKKARGKPPAKWESSNIQGLPGMESAAVAAY